MTPVWDPDEAHTTVYQEVEKHSDGMISYTYRPPSQADLDALKNTETYRGLVREQGKEPMPARESPQG
jgi:hypothetical protein